MGLHELPSELIEAIAENLPYPSLCALSLASRHLHDLATPLLRRDVVLLSSNGRTLHRQHADVAAALEDDATSVTVVSPVPNDTVQGNVKARCPGCDITDFGREEAVGGRLVAEVLGRCRPGRLRKFTWLLGLCIQPDILGTKGILATQQPDLEELRLVTCYHRLGLRCQTRSLDLTPFAHLRSLSWTGIHRSQFPVLERALASSAARLVDLELDFLSSLADHPLAQTPESQTPESTLPYFPRVVLGLPRAEGGAAFPRLASLTLTNVDLTTLAAGQFGELNPLGPALNARNLKALRLRHCPGWESLANCLHPDYSCGDEYDDEWPPLRVLDIHSLASDSHPGHPALWMSLDEMEELSLYKIGQATATADEIVLPSFTFPLLGVRRLVLHEGDVRPPGTRPRVREGGRIGEQLVDGHGMYNPSCNALSNAKLEFLGFASPLESMRILLEQLTPPQAFANLEVLHVRQDHEEVSRYYSRALGYAVPDEDAPPGPGGGIDLRRMLTPESHDLAMWVFTARETFPALKILAFGDFGSFEPRARLLLCPSSSSGGGADPFRLVTGADADAVLVLDRYMGSLVEGPSYSKPHLRASGASLAGNVWRPRLAMFLARESGARGPTVPGTVVEGEDGKGEEVGGRLGARGMCM
ncbi:uncharacterized protein DNG_09532 [Cephalotrichum gorgonifer]|uniref:F-box domain-containing protein n=1 Tax=Cephalotrichum gorgonifer TaxID=2041049 RepID=A0AAE8SZI9_9PEZI|nr:uncharacterized protein DNG_09532 [Cephalotrichum gorgonifer]